MSTFPCGHQRTPANTKACSDRPGRCRICQRMYDRTYRRKVNHWQGSYRVVVDPAVLSSIMVVGTRRTTAIIQNVTN